MQCFHVAYFAHLRRRLAGQTFNFDWSDLSTLLSTSISISVDVKVKVVDWEDREVAPPSMLT